MHPAIASCIEQLLLQLQKKGAEVQAQVDTQLTISLIPTTMQQLFVERIKLHSEHLLHADPEVRDEGQPDQIVTR